MKKNRPKGLKYSPKNTNVENDMYRYEEVNNRRNQLNLKYERT